MIIRRWSVAGLVFATLLTPGLAACNDTAGSTGAAATSAPAIPVDPKQALLDSTKEIKKGNFRFAVTGNELSGQGQVHEPSQSAEIKLKMGNPSADFAMDLDMIYAKPDSYVKFTFAGTMLESVPAMKKLNTGKYQHIDQTKVKNVKGLTFSFDDVDPGQSEALTQGITDVKKTGEGMYSGTIDVSKATNGIGVDEDVVKALGAQAQSLPFTAKLDPQGRLTEFAIQFPAAGEAKAHEMKITYSDYGAATPAQKPAATETVEASPELYNMLNK